jgi:hypothetical protein
VNESTELVHQPHAEIVRAEDFMPLMSVEQAIGRKKMMNAYISGIMTEGDDYGKMPGDSRKDAKKVLLKPGAEKLCSVFGLTTQYHKETVIEDWTGADHDGEPLFYYEYRCQLSRGGRYMGEAIGSCNSWETKYRFRWVQESQVPANLDKATLATKGGRISEPDFAIAKAETGGRYGKPMEYWQRFRDEITAGTATKVKRQKKGGGEMDAWEIDSTMYRIPNPDVADVVNTCQKMAQKRALVAAVLVVTNCSDAFTQDVEDFSDGSHEPAPAPVKTDAMLPEELADLFTPDAPKGALRTAFNMCQQELIEADPVNGEVEFRRIMDNYGIRKGAQMTLGQARQACIDCWTLAKQTKAKAPKESALEITDDDIGF